MDFKYTSKVLEINKDRLIGNRELTNEILVDDIMINLGYNKKLMNSINRVYTNDKVDWVVCIDGHTRILLKTVPYGTITKIEDSIEIEWESIFDFYLITNGVDIDIYDINIDKNNPLLSISIFNEDKITSNILKFISLEEYSKEEIIKIYDNKFITKDILENKIHSIKYNVSKSILNILEYEENERNLDTVVEYMGDKINVDKTFEEQLKVEVETLKETNTALNNKFKDMEIKYTEYLKSSDMKAARIVEKVENNTESNLYVAVVKDKVIKDSNLKKFIGSCINELYSIVGLDIVYELFAGDTFKIINSTENIAFSINNKSYDIDLEKVSEVIAISKLMRLYNKFSHVVFKVKVLEPKELNRNDVIIGLPVTKLSTIWENEFKQLKLIYVGTEDTLYDLQDNTSYDSLTASIIQYLLEMSEDKYSSVCAINDSNINLKNKHIVLKETELGIRIHETNFSITGVDSINKSIAIIKGISNILGMYTDKYRLYFNIGNDIVKEEIRKYIVNIEDFIVE